MIKHILLFIILVMLSGCWGAQELPEINIVSGVGIDKIESGEYEVTTQTIQPLAVKENLPEAFLVRSSTGWTMFEAVRDLIITSGKKQLWEHVNTFIISEEVAREEVLPVIGYLLRDHEPRPSMLCFISKSKAKDILKIKSKVEPIPAMAIEKALEEQKSLAKAPIVPLHTFTENILASFQDPYLPIITKGAEDFEIYGTAIFKKDKMIGELTPRETRAMLRVLDELDGGLQVVNLAQPNEPPNYASIEIKDFKSKIEAEMKDDKPRIIINIEEKGVIGDISQPTPITHNTTQEIEKIYAETVRQEVEKTVKKIQKELQANVLGFAGVINRQHKDYFQKHKEQWDVIYPSLEVEVIVQTEIEHSQLINDSVDSN